MYPPVVAVPDEPADLVGQFYQHLEPFWVSQVDLELRIRRFLQPVLPRRRFGVPGDEYARSGSTRVKILDPYSWPLSEWKMVGRS